MPAIRNVQADMSMLFLSANYMPFLQRTTDLWYRATTRMSSNKTLSSATLSIGAQGLQAYYQDEPASPLACYEQEQLCMLNKWKKCTPLSPRFDLSRHVEAIISANDSSGDLNRCKWFYNILTTPSEMLGNAIQFLEIEALTARRSLAGGAQGPLATNQWQIDAEFWFATLLANTQQAFVRAVSSSSFSSSYSSSSSSGGGGGGEGTDLDRIARVGPKSMQSQEMCQNQKILSSAAYSSFSLFGLGFTVVMGVVIILASYAVEPVLGWLYRRHFTPHVPPHGTTTTTTTKNEKKKRTAKHGRGYRFLEWQTNSTLQLQRLAHQGVGVREWSGGVANVPLTIKPEENLGMLDLTDPAMPRLKVPMTRNAQEEETVMGRVFSSDSTLTTTTTTTAAAASSGEMNSGDIV